ncbi:D-glycerate dehydrogenase [Psychromonas sp. 14N.309.X.WAT.B.A12]|uniref:2-hydroxyacid dehydrogenase n=1 Tax=Psychromonas sp. 14N.309.X.WAT.B.A12 TaxID=2998322 RepID=UPI0025B1F4CC|nr:D-glycerate dehydrogenase [Psychromonas sp. 14N.309.X.WAT.B.A12]MDN2662688.1 D-glycerate dehydrogenase [Psychromonas sp. 14N.309.X.WAT.B.A12]
MKDKVVLYKKIPEQQKLLLSQMFNLICFDKIDESNLKQFIHEIKDAIGLIGSGVKLHQEILQHALNLKVISTISVGYDHFDLEYLKSRKIALMNTPDVLTDTTADTIFTLIMCSARRTTELNNFVTSGKWSNNLKDDYFGVDIHGKKLGILGMGRIGYAVAKRAHLGFDMQINYYNRSVNSKAEEKLDAQKMELDELLADSDFVCSILPANQQTDRLIGQRELELMKNSAIFINGGRGNVVDQDALAIALKNQTIRAAGLDVYEVEPLPHSSPLMELKNVTLFPHIGSATSETRLAMITCAIENLKAAYIGDLTKNCVVS